MNQGFILIDSNKNVELINDEALKILKAKKESVLNKGLPYLIRDNELIDSIDEVFTNNSNLKKEIIIDDKHYIFFIAKNESLVSMFIVDITMEHQMIVMKKEFFDNASHELKSPLQTIIGYQEMISNGIITKEDEVKHAISRTIAEAYRMNSIIVEMLELSRLEGANKPVKLERVLVKSNIHLVLDSLDSQIKERGIEVKLDLDDSYSYIESNDLNRLLVNLISNAIKYNKDKGSIMITLKNEVLTISDTGIGIASQNIDRIFERFYRVDKAKSKELNGTGLGLAIVKHICKLYGFTISVESELMVGTSFIIKLK